MIGLYILATIGAVSLVCTIGFTFVVAAGIWDEWRRSRAHAAEIDQALRLAVHPSGRPLREGGAR